jgi:myo-inositol-1(or 4)-monophosphatase
MPNKPTSDVYIYAMNSQSLVQITSQVRAASQKAADFIRSHVGEVSNDQIESKEQNSLVSYVDKTAEKILVEALTPILPSPGFLTEEDTVENSRSEYTWIIDPLDGTTNFLQQIPIFSVSVGLAHNGEIIVGVVIDVMQDDCYYAWKGGGAWLDGKRIHVSNRSAMSEAIVATGFPYYEPDKLDKLTDLFREVLASVRGIRRLGSAALDLTYVACGKMDAFYETQLNPWDVAAGTILVREAGGLVTDFIGNGDFVEKKQIIGSNGLLHQGVTDVLARHVVG